MAASGTSKVFRASLSALATLLATACSVANLTTAVDTRPEPEPEPDYRRIVAAGIKANLKEVTAFAPLEISPIRRTTATQYGDWMVCVRGKRNDGPAYFGVFMREHKILNWGEAVIVDRCEAEAYEPLPPPEEPPPSPIKANPPKPGR
jgi:hypothetical protein